MLFFWWVKLKENAFNRQLRYFMVISGVYSSAACDLCCCPAVQLAAGHGVTAVCTAVCCVCVCACVLFFFLSFSFNFNFELCACLLFAVCDKWVDFRGGNAVQCIINILYQYHVSYASDLACIKHNRMVKAAGRTVMRFVVHLMQLCLLCCALCLIFAEHCLFSGMLFHMLFKPK